MGNAEDREGVAEGKTDDVEGHGPFGDSPTVDQPAVERNDEGDDVEGHMLNDSPAVESPNVE